MLTTIAIIALGLATLVLATLLRYPSYRGKRVLICPETRQPVGAEIDALIAARTEIAGEPQFVISSCSRWPERAGCDQACAPQVAASPRETLVHDIVTRWYRGKHCVYCGKIVDGIDGVAIPGLRGIDGKLREWKNVAPEDLPGVLSASLAVCARCDLTEGFRRDFPRLVLDRPRTDLRPLPPPLRSSAVY